MAGIIWVVLLRPHNWGNRYASPFSLRVCHIPKAFFRILDRNFPKGHKYYSFCNRSSIKFSYSITLNLASIIASLNRSKLEKYDLSEWVSYNEPGAQQSVTKSTNGYKFGKLAYMNPTIGCDMNSFKVGQEASVSNNNLATRQCDRLCNCRDPNLCLLVGFCLVKNIIYKCLVRAEGQVNRFYIDSTLNF